MTFNKVLYFRHLSVTHAQYLGQQLIKSAEYFIFVPFRNAVVIFRREFQNSFGFANGCGQTEHSSNEKATKKSLKIPKTYSRNLI